MKSITVTVTNRTKYLKRLLDTLSCVENIKNWNVFFSIEPNCENSITLIESYSVFNKTIIKRNEKLGILHHPYTLLSEVFIKSELNIYLEEDVIVSPDLINISDFYYTHSTNYVLLDFFNKFNRDNDENLIFSVKDSCIDGKNVFFTPFSWVTTRQNWNEYISNWWYLDTQHCNKGWDFSVVTGLVSNSKSFLIPSTCRTNHIGDYGTHVNLEYNIKNHSNICLAKNKINNYRITNLL